MEDAEEQLRRSQPHGRSAFSSNWRTKDTTPRAEPSPRNNRTFNANRDQQTGSPGFQNDQSGPAPPSTRLYVGNLLYTASRSDVETFFTSNGFALSGISMSVDPFTGRNPSYAFVDLETAEEASRAMETLNGMELSGRNVKINPGVKREGGPREARVRNYEGDRDGRTERGEVSSSYKPTYDRFTRTDNLEQGLRLYVGNLPRIEPQAAADAQMQELFGSEGFEITAVSKMISPHPSKASEPGNHYYCFVDMANQYDMERAIEALNGREVEGWGAIRVNRARDNRDRKPRQYDGERRSNGPRGEESGSGWRSRDA